MFTGRTAGVIHSNIYQLIIYAQVSSLHFKKIIWHPYENENCWLLFGLKIFLSKAV